MSLHRTCCCTGEPSRLWLAPSLCNDEQPTSALVFNENDCNLTLNSQLYRYDDGAFFGGLQYCGVLRRESDYAIPAGTTEVAADAGDCDDIDIATCSDCISNVCGYWGDCDEPTITMSGYTDTGWQFPDDGFGETQQYRARVTAVNIGAGSWVVKAGFGMRWEYDLVVTAEAELLDASGCGSRTCGDEPLQPQTWTWDTTLKLSVTCDGGTIQDTVFDPQGPYVCEDANSYDLNGNAQPYRDVSKWKTTAAGSGSGSSTLAPTDTECVFTGDWSVTQGIDVQTGIAEADAGFDAVWRDCVSFRGLFLNTIQLTISGTYA